MKIVNAKILLLSTLREAVYFVLILFQSSTYLILCMPVFVFGIHNIKMNLDLQARLWISMILAYLSDSKNAI